MSSSKGKKGGLFGKREAPYRGTQIPLPRKIRGIEETRAIRRETQIAEAKEAAKKVAVHDKIDSLNVPKFMQMKGSKLFRLRIICSLLSGKAIRIDEIRSADEKPGLRDYEISFLRLIDRITNGTRVKINETGTSLKFTPGILLGGEDIEHECPPTRCVGYFLEALMILAPFSKTNMSIRLTGCVTNMDTDISVDIFRAVTIPMMKHFGIGATDPAGNVSPAPTLKVVKRGAPPSGGGEVLFTCPIVKQLEPLTLVDPGRVKRVRGVAYTTRCSPALAQRMATSARGVFNNFIPDVMIYTDAYKGKESGGSPGYGISLAADSTTGCLHSAQRTSMSPAALLELSKTDPALLPSQLGDVDPSRKIGEDDDDEMRADEEEEEEEEEEEAKDDDDEDSGDDENARARALAKLAKTRKRAMNQSKKRQEPLTLEEEITRSAQELMLPENLGRVAGKLVVEEIAEGGCIDSAHQSLFIMLMALGPEDVSRLRVGKLTDQAVQTLRLLKDFWNIIFKITPDPNTKTLLLSCMGIGYSNMARRTI